jgi:hypothetical protein
VTAALRVPKDVTGALRARRYRQKKASEINPVVTVTTEEMCGLAGRLGAGRATVEDLHLAERLLLALMQLLPPDSAIDI